MSECKIEKRVRESECKGSCSFLFCVFAWVFLSCDLFTVMIAGGTQKVQSTVELPVKIKFCKTRKINVSTPLKSS